MKNEKKEFQKPEAEVIQFEKNIDTVTQSVSGGAGGYAMEEGDEN